MNLRRATQIGARRQSAGRYCTAVNSVLLAYGIFSSCERLLGERSGKAVNLCPVLWQDARLLH